MRFILILSFFALTSTLLTAQLVGETENGLASYYSNEYQGAKTAYGETYQKTDLVAAHRMYPYNSIVRVRNVENGRSVTVRIIDKGPFIKGRIIELSEQAAANLGMIGKETVQVELTLVSTPDQPARVASRTEAEARAIEEALDETNRVSTTPTPAETPTPAQRTVVQTPPAPSTYSEPAPAPAKPAPAKPADVQPAPTRQAAAPEPTVSEAAAVVKATPVSNAEVIRTAGFTPGTYRIQLSKPTAGTFGVQVGSFKDLESAMAKVTEMQAKWFDNVMIEKVSTGSAAVYKVILGPSEQPNGFATQKSAARYASDLKKRYKIDGFTVEIK